MHRGVSRIRRRAMVRITPTTSDPAVVVDTEEDKLLVEDRLSDWILEVSISPELTAAPSKSALPHTLWRPTPLLEEVLDTVESSVTARRALDLGCGSGRDSVFLALRGWHVVGIDVVEKACARARAFAERHGVVDRTEFRAQEIRNLQDPTQYDLVLVCRTSVQTDPLQYVAPGGHLLWHHFLEGSSHPSEDKVLKKGELQRRFGHRTEIILDDERTLAPPDGRPCSYFLCRKHNSTPNP
eukprot:GEMP01094128.1.p1 GENE.GEMP01094128.1~~GEMP01094128.1.p1  ORF type:complete len:240 (+),score=48.48 GEMP01094128.1:151-870(+)